MTARSGENPHQRYRRLTASLGEPFYARTDAPATPAQKAAFKVLDPATMPATLAGDPVTDVTTTARGNGASLGGVKVSTANGWFAARPSGTENVVKVYAESFVDAGHLAAIQADAQAVMARWSRNDGRGAPLRSRGPVRVAADRRVPEGRDELRRQAAATRQPSVSPAWKGTRSPICAGTVVARRASVTRSALTGRP